MLAVRSFRRDFGYYFEGEPVLPAAWQSAFNAISSVGQFGGGFLCSYVADRFGRRLSLVAGLLICTGGIVGEIVSTSNVAFLISKLILGVGLGFYLTIAPLVTSEISPVAFRGIATAGVQFGIGSGQLLSNAAIKGFGEWESRWAYRAPFALQLFFCAFLAAGLPFVPESPWWLARMGRRDQAKKALRQLYGSDVDVEIKLVNLEATIAEEEAASSEQGSIIQCFKGTNLIRTTISICIFLCQHFTGKRIPKNRSPPPTTSTHKSSRNYLRSRVLVIFLSTRRLGDVEELRPRCGGHGSWCRCHDHQLVHRRASRSSQHLPLRHGYAHNHPPSHWDSRRRANRRSQMGPGISHYCV